MDPHMRRFLWVLHMAGIEFALDQRGRDCLLPNCYIGMLHDGGEGEASLYFVHDLGADDLQRLATVARGEVLIVLPESFDSCLGARSRLVINRVRAVRITREEIVKHAVCVIDSDSSEQVVLIERHHDKLVSVPRARANQAIYDRTRDAPPPGNRKRHPVHLTRR